MTRQRRPRPASQAQRISGPAELLQAVPYLLGFHPARSLVLVGLDDGLLVVTARLDLADAATAALAHALGAMVRGGSAQFIAAVYDDDAVPDAGGVLPWRELVDSLERHTAGAGCDLLDVLHVARGRWWSYLCRFTACCPPEGQPLPQRTSPFAAAATYNGVVALPDRRALEAQLDPVAEPERARLADPLVAAERGAVRQTINDRAQRWETSVKRALFAAAREADRPVWFPPSDADAARFGVALRTAPVRDALWLAVDHGRLDGRPLWRSLGRGLPSPYDAAPLFLFGWASWRAGDGAMAAIAAERTVASDPNYTAADLLLAALKHAVDPRRMPRLRMPRSA